MTLNFSKHKNILLQILKDIYSDTSIAPHLGFKGGTAAMMFYDLPRPSVDLDFDLLDETKEKEVFEKINEIVSHYGEITDSYMQKHNLRNVISYEVDAQKIKVEVNLRQFGSKYEMKTLLGISMLVMVQEDMFAHKLMAFLERIAARDIFDVHYFAKNNWPINRKIVEDRSGVSYKEALEKCIDLLEKMDNKHILDGMGEFFTGPEKDSLRVKLKPDTIFLLKVMLSNTSKVDSMASYSANEIAEIKDILNTAFFKCTPFACKKLKIEKKMDSFFQKDNDRDSGFGYEIECDIDSSGKNENIFITPTTQKVDTTMTAFHIAHEVWGKFDKSDSSQLWKNFEPKTK